MNHLNKRKKEKKKKHPKAKVHHGNKKLQRFFRRKNLFPFSFRAIIFFTMLLQANDSILAVIPASD